jgi:hypothetical protein
MAQPGSPAKLAVLRWRHRRGFLLWHPEDFRGDPEEG